MRDKVQFGFRCKVCGRFNIFYVDQLVMPVPAIEAQYGVTMPVDGAVQKNRTLTFLALTVNLHIVFGFLHKISPVIDLQSTT
jgi:hypothetical protein